MWSWRGPAPYHFVSVPDEECAELQEAAAFVTYDWGMIPVTVRIGETVWTTSLPRRSSSARWCRLTPDYVIRSGCWGDHFV